MQDIFLLLIDYHGIIKRAYTLPDGRKLKCCNDLRADKLLTKETFGWVKERLEECCEDQSKIKFDLRLRPAFNSPKIDVSIYPYPKKMCCIVVGQAEQPLPQILRVELEHPNGVTILADNAIPGDYAAKMFKWIDRFNERQAKKGLVATLAGSAEDTTSRTFDTLKCVVNDYEVGTKSLTGKTDEIKQPAEMPNDPPEGSTQRVREGMAVADARVAAEKPPKKRRAS